MIVIAVLLLAAAAAVTVGVALGSEQDAVFDIFGETVRAPGWAVLAIGAACGFVVPIAFWLLRIGTRRARARRREQRALRAEHQRQRAELERQRVELEAERERMRDGGLVRPHAGSGAAGDRPSETQVGGVPAERPGGRSGEGRGSDRLLGEHDRPPAGFDVQRPGARPFGSPSSGLGPPPADSGGFGSFTRPPDR